MSAGLAGEEVVPRPKAWHAVAFSTGVDRPTARPGAASLSVPHGVEPSTAASSAVANGRTLSSIKGPLRPCGVERELSSSIEEADGAPPPASAIWRAALFFLSGASGAGVWLGSAMAVSVCSCLVRWSRVVTQGSGRRQARQRYQPAREETHGAACRRGGAAPSGRPRTSWLE